MMRRALPLYRFWRGWRKSPIYGTSGLTFVFVISPHWWSHLQGVLKRNKMPFSLSKHVSLQDVWVRKRPRAQFSGQIRSILFSRAFSMNCACFFWLLLQSLKNNVLFNDDKNNCYASRFSMGWQWKNIIKRKAEIRNHNSSNEEQGTAFLLCLTGILFLMGAVLWNWLVIDCPFELKRLRGLIPGALLTVPFPQSCVCILSLGWFPFRCFNRPVTLTERQSNSLVHHNWKGTIGITNHTSECACDILASLPALWDWLQQVLSLQRAETTYLVVAICSAVESLFPFLCSTELDGKNQVTCLNSSETSPTVLMSGWIAVLPSLC